ncbi:MAG: HNH endonuclease [Thermodesulfobacteriota bacterium]
MNNSALNKSKLLGMPHGTASHRLKKMILFNLAMKLNFLTCYRCTRLISNIDDFSIDHVKAWQQSKNPKLSFFDINNIRFSHSKCNRGAAKNVARKHKTDEERRIANRESKNRWVKSICVKNEENNI